MGQEIFSKIKNWIKMELKFFLIELGVELVTETKNFVVGFYKSFWEIKPFFISLYKAIFRPKVWLHILVIVMFITILRGESKNIQIIILILVLSVYFFKRYQEGHFRRRMRAAYRRQ